MVSTGGLAGLCVAGLIAIGAPFLAYFLFRARLTLSLRNILVGAVCFILFSFAIELPLNNYLLASNPVSAAWFKAHGWIYALYGAFAAGLFEETGRLVGFGLLARKSDGAGTALAYGIGHGGAEAIIVGGLGIFQSLVLAFLYNHGKLDQVLSAKFSPDKLAAIHSKLAHLTFFNALPGGFERLSALTLQIALSFLVWRAVTRKEWRFYFLAILAHTAFDVPAMLLQRGIIHPGVWQLEAGYAALAVVVAGILLSRLPPKQTEPA